MMEPLALLARFRAGGTGTGCGEVEAAAGVAAGLQAVARAGVLADAGATGVGELRREPSSMRGCSRMMEPFAGMVVGPASASGSNRMREPFLLCAVAEPASPSASNRKLEQPLFPGKGMRWMLLEAEAASWLDGDGHCVCIAM